MKFNTSISGLIGALCLLSSAPAFANINPRINTSLRTGTNIIALSDLASNDLDSSVIRTANLYFDIGYELLGKKDYYGAIRYFNQALATYPRLYKVYYYRGHARLGLGDKIGASKDFLLSPGDHILNPNPVA